MEWADSRHSCELLDVGLCICSMAFLACRALFDYGIDDHVEMSFILNKGFWIPAMAAGTAHLLCT
jgi:hypothetical protein